MSVLLRGRGHWIVLALLIALTGAVSFCFPAAIGFRFFSALLAACYLFCLPMLQRVIAEYEAGSRMRTAWMLLWCMAVISVARHLLDLVSSFYQLATAREFRAASLVATDLSLILQLIAFILLLSCFRQLGITRPFRWWDGILVAIVAVLVLFCFSEARFFPHSASPEAFFRDIEFLNPILFAATTVIGLLLYRLSVDIGPSDFSLSILFLMLQLFARFIGFSLQILEREFASTHLTQLSNLFYWAYPFLFLWAVLFRSRMIEGAAESVIVQESEKLKLSMLNEQELVTALSSKKELRHN